MATCDSEALEFMLHCNAPLGDLRRTSAPATVQQQQQSGKRCTRAAAPRLWTEEFDKGGKRSFERISENYHLTVKMLSDECRQRRGSNGIFNVRKVSFGDLSSGLTEFGS